jgi:hypothetical protein
MGLRRHLLSIFRPRRPIFTPGGADFCLSGRLPLLGNLQLKLALARHGPRGWRIDPSSAGPSRSCLSQRDRQSAPSPPKRGGADLFPEGERLPRASLGATGNSKRMRRMLPNAVEVFSPFSSAGAYGTAAAR